MDLELKTPAGGLRGLQREGHQAFLGIPFAAAPVGPLRFAAPQPIAAWSGVRDAQTFGSHAPQSLDTRFPAHGPQGEDCLYLNVYTPRADGRRRPVLFWIHGGGFTSGAGSEPLYDGAALAALGDVVVVTINYRLGAFGYLYLDKRGADSDPAPASNCGQLDQIAALRWVRANIAAFGGDPDQVTIFGESAGSVAVCALLAMPDADGLYIRAIAQSGTANRLGNLDTASAVSQQLVEKLGLSAGASPAGLRELTTQQLMAAQQALGGMVFAPIIDGTTLPDRPLKAVRDGRARAIPLLIGTNRDETKLYIDPRRAELDDEQLAQRVRAVLPHRAREQVSGVIATYRASRQAHSLPHTNNDLLDAIETASRFGIPASRLAEAQSAHQTDTYAYLFDWESPARRHTMGACHALELPFVFGTTHLPSMKLWVGAGPEADKLSGQMMQSWLAFAKTGNPSCEATGAWPGYDGAQRKTMIFGRATRVEAAPFEQERALWDSLL